MSATARPLDTSGKPPPVLLALGGRTGAMVVFCLVTVLYAVAVVLTVAEPWTERILQVFPYAYALVGALIALRRPRNRIAWLCLAIGSVWGLSSALRQVVIYESVHTGLLSRPDLMLAVGNPLWVAGVGLSGTFLLLLLPDGHLPSPRWRPLAWLSAIAMITFYGVLLFLPVDFSASEWPVGVENPFAVEALSGLVWVVAPMYFGCIAASVVALLLRYRRASGIELLQLKWLVSAGAAAVVGLLLYNLLSSAFGIAGSGVNAVTVVPNVSIPVAIGVAVLRYRLYAIDRLVSRTVTYAIVVGLLAGIYAAAVFVLASLLPLEGDLAVAASTLVVAALFNPLRRRVQQWVDRRFNRPRFDAALEVERFAGRLRTHLNLDELSDDLVGVVSKTVQPSTASVWIRGDRR